MAIFHKHGHCTLYESFRISGSYPARSKVVVPELAIEIPNQVFDDADFRSQLAGSLSGGMSPADMLRGVGHAVEPRCVTKHVDPTFAQDPGSRSLSRWSRSALWFFIKVIIQSYLDRSPLDHGTYKTFMLFFMCNLADYAGITGVTCVLLHSMSAKILRCFRKLGPASPQWLRNTVLHTCTTLSLSLDQTQRNVQVARSSPSWDLTQLDLTNDIHPSLPHIQDYISTTLASSGSDPLDTLSLYDDHFRYTLRHSRIHVALRDVEQAVGNDIDNWVSCVANVDEACEQLEKLVHRYQPGEETYDPDHHSLCS